METFTALLAGVWRRLRGWLRRGVTPPQLGERATDLAPATPPDVPDPELAATPLPETPWLHEPPIHAVVVLSTGPGRSRATAALERSDGSVHTHEVTADELSRTAHQRLVLDAFEWLYAQCRQLPGDPVETYVAYGTVRRELTLLAASFPRVRLLSEPTAAHLGLIAAVQPPPPNRPQPAPVPPMPRPAPLPSPPLRIVATDASRARHRAGAGIACVDAQGTFAQGFARTTSIAVAELRAIDLAVRTFPGDDLLILSDSRQALAWLADPARVPDPHVRRLVGAIVSESHRRRIRFEWVKGHDGHRLNETADRLAMAARRAREFQQDESVSHRIADGIIHDLVAA